MAASLINVEGTNLPPELLAQLVGTQNRQRIADAMLQQSMAPIENMGGAGAKLHWSQGLAKVLQAYMGRKGLDDVDRIHGSVAAQKESGLNAEKLAYLAARDGAPAQPPLTPNDDDGNPMPQVAATPGDPRAAVQMALMSRFGLSKDPVVAADIKAWEKSQEPYTLGKDAKRMVGNAVIAQGERTPLVKEFVTGKNDKGMPLVQARQSFDGGSTWKDVPGTQPYPKWHDAETKPFFQFLDTPGGIVVGDARTGSLKQGAVSGSQPAAAPAPAPAGVPPEVIAASKQGPFTATQTPDGKVSVNPQPAAPVMMSKSDPAQQAKIAASKEAGQQGAKMNSEEHTKALESADALPKINMLIQHVKSSNAITGPAADIMLGLEKAKQFVTASEASGKKVTDTQIADILMGAEVFPLIKSLGIGARGMDTPAEREFMRSVLTGTIGLNRDTLIKMAEMRRDAAMNNINKFNQRFDRGELANYFRDVGRTPQRINIPGGTTYPANDAAAGGGLTPQEADERAQLRKRFGLK